MSELVTLDSFEKVFVGEQFAVGLTRRGEKDAHVLFTVLSEDDGAWFVSSGTASSFWLPHLASVVGEAQAWCAAHCDKDLADDSVTSWGWKFRDGS